MKRWLAFSPRRGVVKGLFIAGLVVGGFIAGYATAAQPHMFAALNALQTARAELAVAEHNKGGHRAVALQRVDEAINQVKMGIEAGGG